MTPHNAAKPGDYAEAVLLPGDPLRAKWIAETFLEEPRLVNSVRNCLGYTGSWAGKPVSVQATGMGQPSLSIYVHELINVYGVKTLLRVGTCGGLNASVKVRDLILAQAASTDSTIVKDGFGNFSFAPIADFGLLRSAAGMAEANGAQGACRQHAELRHLLPYRARHGGLWPAASAWRARRRDGISGALHAGGAVWGQGAHRLRHDRRYPHRRVDRRRGATVIAEVEMVELALDVAGKRRLDRGQKAAAFLPRLF